jgi:hypothetical protein
VLAGQTEGICGFVARGVLYNAPGGVDAHALGRVVRGQGGDNEWRRRDENSPEVRNALHQILVFAVFMIIFTWCSTRDLNNQALFNFGESLRAQLIDVEFLENRAGIKYGTISSVDEFYRFLQGPLVETVFGPATFDGDEQWRFQEGKQGGTALGYSAFLGAIKISQLRASKTDCSSDVSKVLALSDDSRWYCYKSSMINSVGERDFDVSMESTDAYGSIEGWDGPAFRFDGRNGFTGESLREGNVKESRTKWFHNFYSDEFITYPSSAFAITLDSHQGREAAREALVKIQNASYIDLHTKVVFVDIQLYNPMLDRVCWFRLVAEMGDFGGVQPSFELGVVKPWESIERNTSEDQRYFGLQICVMCFYFFYFIQEVAELLITGRQYWTRWINLFQVANIASFTTSVAIRFWIEPQLLPARMLVDGSEFYELGPLVKAIHRRINIEACCVWMNWFKLIPILSLIPTFRIMVLTLERASKNVGGFAVVFGFVMYGFVQAHAMVFGARIKEFRSMTQSAFALIRALMGDVNFDRMQEADPWMAPLFFTLFNTLAIFVVLNMLIAIISDAYFATAKEMKDEEDFPFVNNMAKHVHKLVLSVPLLGNAVRYVEAAARDTHALVEEKRKAMELSIRLAASRRASDLRLTAGAAGSKLKSKSNALKKSMWKKAKKAGGAGTAGHSMSIHPSGFGAESEAERDRPAAGGVMQFKRGERRASTISRVVHRLRKYEDEFVHNRAAKMEKVDSAIKMGGTNSSGGSAIEVDSAGDSTAKMAQLEEAMNRKFDALTAQNEKLYEMLALVARRQEQQEEKSCTSRPANSWPPGPEPPEQRVQLHI